eukprot:s724_g33.t1
MEGCQLGVTDRRSSFKSDVTCSTRAQSKETGDEEMVPGLFFHHLRSQMERRLSQHGFADLDAETTVMLRNLPECFTRARLLYLLCKEGFSGRFNFLYVPVCFRERNSLCVMHPSVPDECKPILLSGTKRIPFPSPLKKIKMPKKLKGSDANLDQKLMKAGDPVVMLIL